MVFIETTVFTRQIRKLITDDSYSELQRFLLKSPIAGDLIGGSNGCRKIRWTVSGGGKRGGIRLIYFWIAEVDQMLMLIAYSKASKENLTPEQTKTLGKLVEQELRTS